MILITELHFWEWTGAYVKCLGLGLWRLAQLSTIFQLYLADPVLLVEETGVPRENH